MYFTRKPHEPENSYVLHTRATIKKAKSYIREMAEISKRMTVVVHHIHGHHHHHHPHQASNQQLLQQQHHLAISQKVNATSGTENTGDTTNNKQSIIPV